eukprot:gene4118-8189_t
MDVNVKVVVRCRPLSEKEKARNCFSVINITENTVHVSKGETEDKQSDKDFTFDVCYGADSLQEQVHIDLGKPIVKNALEGYNSTVFAYGQTGSGKTHTMMGYDTNQGLIPRLNSELFQSIREKLEGLKTKGAAGTTKCMITVSYLEIYNEVIRDLLNPSDKKLPIRESPTAGIYVEGLCELF